MNPTMLPYNYKIRWISLAICLFLCFSLMGCETGSVPSAPISSATEQAATPINSPESTPERTAEITSPPETIPATPESTPAPSGLLITADVDSAYMVMSAVVGGYYVYMDHNDIYSVPCNDLDAEPILLEPGTIPFYVWNGKIVVYARPEADSPYRSILVSPDGSERRVIDKRQSEYYNTIGGVGDYCYANVNGLVRYSLSQDKVEKLFGFDGFPLGIVNGFFYSVNYRYNAIWRNDLETGEKVPAFSDKDNNSYSAIAMRGFILIFRIENPTYILLPDGTVHKLFDSGVTVHSPWASTPDYMYVSIHEGDMDSPVIGTYCIAADGVYPMEDYANGVRVENDAEGNVYLPGVDVDGYMPIEDFPIVMEMGVRSVDSQ